EHPFFTQEQGWVPAGELRVGEHVRTADGRWGTVERATAEQHPAWMYNLTVAHDHTFFVGQGQWLVHKAIPGILPRDRKTKVACHLGIHCPIHGPYQKANDQSSARESHGLV